MPIRFEQLRSTMRGERDPSRYPYLKVLHLEVEAIPALNSLVFKGNVMSQTTSQVYKSTIQFFGVSFTAENELKPGEASRLPHVDFRGEQLYFQAPSLAKSEARIHDTCPDFRFMWMKQDHDVGSLVGDWIRYRRLTPPPVRPAHPVNPNPIGKDFKNPGDYPGFCKHLASLARFLIDKGFVVR